MNKSNNERKKRRKKQKKYLKLKIRFDLRKMISLFP